MILRRRLPTRWIQKVLLVAIVALISMAFFGNDFPVLLILETKTQEHKPDFSFNRESWDRNSSRIVILLGPHKTASTSLQAFLVKMAAQVYSVTNTTYGHSTFKKKPHPAITEWVWPLGIEEEMILAGGLPENTGQWGAMKYYAYVAALITGKLDNSFWMPAWEDNENMADYFRSLLRRPWEEGKKIVIGSEELDNIVSGLVEESRGGAGEEIHIATDSGDMIDGLLDLFPWDNTTTAPSDANDNLRTPSLRLEDIEVLLNYRTPRIDHVISVWHQGGQDSTLREFLSTRLRTLLHTNSLALALQFARKGIKTTMIDMSGVYEKEARESTYETIETVYGGLEGVVACDVLGMGKDNGLCDDHSKLHLYGYQKHETTGVKNKKSDSMSRNMTDAQLEEINAVLEEYDCGVWQHLQKYQAKGTFRILYPSEYLFASCKNVEGAKCITFRDTLETVKEIVLTH
jgi:hypothetical protein